MDHKQKIKIDYIISKIADEGMSSDNSRQLEGLLLNDPEAQDYYSRVITVNTLLAGEYAHTNSLFASSHSASSEEQDNASQSDKGCAVLTKQIEGDIASRVNIKQILVAALSLAALILVAISFPYSSTSEVERVAERSRLWSASNASLSPEDDILVRDKKSLDVLGQLTQSPLVSSLTLPVNYSPNIQLCSGTAWINRLPTQRERGYLVALPAGCLMNVFLDTDARAQNSFAMVGISDTGTTNENKMRFNNSVGSEQKSRNNPRMGCIGKYSEFNDTSSTKYFLFVGSYVKQDEKGAPHWAQSDYKVLVDSGNLLVIGWDDCGYTDYVANTADHTPPDQDYNDLRATLQFSYPGSEATSPDPNVSYLPELTGNEEIADTTGTGCFLDVKPGESLIFSISSEARLQNAARIIDSSSRRVLWNHVTSANAKESNLSQVAEDGVFVIRNNGDIVKRYEIQGRFKLESEIDGEWITSQHKTAWKEEGVEVIGFEDSIETQGLIDWQDLRINARWITNTP